MFTLNTCKHNHVLNTLCTADGYIRHQKIFYTKLKAKQLAIASLPYRCYSHQSTYGANFHFKSIHKLII